MGILRAAPVEVFLHQAADHLHDMLLLVRAFQQFPPPFIDRLALLVVDVIVFEQVFAGFEVLRLHGFLGLLNAFGDELRFDRHILFHAQAQHEALRLGMEEDVPIESKLITKRIQKAQEAVEAQNFEARKHLLEYDDVNNKQRQAIYKRRRELLEGSDQKERIMEMVRGLVEQYLDMRCTENTHPDTWDLAGLKTDVLSQFGCKIETAEFASMNRKEIEDAIAERLAQKYQEKEDLVGPDTMRQTERIIMLQVIDDQWKDHLLSMDTLKEGIHLRGYGQKDPLVEYKKESWILFQDMMDRIEDETLRYLFFLQVSRGEPGLERREPVLPSPLDEDGEDEQGDGAEENGHAAAAERQKRAAQSAVQDMTKKLQRDKEKELAGLQFVGGDGSAAAKKQVINTDKVGRNEPCPCGSGKKYKKCHGA